MILNLKYNILQKQKWKLWFFFEQEETNFKGFLSELLYRKYFIFVFYSQRAECVFERN